MTAGLAVVLGFMVEFVKASWQVSQLGFIVGSDVGLAVGFAVAPAAA